jgi:hypothetical protein
MAYGWGVFAGGLIVGAIAGLLPLLYGRRSGQGKIALAGLICCIVAGLIAGAIGAVPLAVIFAIVIAIRGRRNVKPVPDAKTADDPERDAAPGRQVSR